MDRAGSKRIEQLKLKFTRKAEKDLETIPLQLRIKILRKAKERLESDPSPDGNQIKKIVEDPLGTLHRLRIGRYRLLFEVHGGDVIVLRCIHRKDLETAIRQLRQRGQI
ncbi:TPA: hypothetical protein DCL37_05495 [Candidatus Acetothermia bacterium]|nr:hypothetical protein [Candidatus Acetothermia bacterium]